jgi:hypothetical protein
MKRILPVVAILFALTFAGPAAHAGTQCQSAGSVEDILSFQQNDGSTQVDLGAFGSPMEASHGGRIPHCGDFCEPEGASGGCVYYGSNGHLVRVQARCLNGHWTPYP